MKVAIIHDWLRVNAGSEKVIREMLWVLRNDHPDLYTLFNKLPKAEQKELLGTLKPKVGILQFFPWIGIYYRYLLPVLPMFIRWIKPKGCDYYLSSSHAVAKGFHADPRKLHVCYCHTPMRYAWYLHEDYLNDVGSLQRKMLHVVLPFLRTWDIKTSQRVHYFIANSKHIQKQIEEIYKRDAVVIYPPVMTDKFELNTATRLNYYLAVGRFVSYKKMQVVIEAFRRMPDKKLVLIGDGYDSKPLKELLLACPNIIWLGYQEDHRLIEYMQWAKACVFAAKEDFGIMCVEAQCTGTPVLALRNGGYRETVEEGMSGYFFEKQDAEDIIDVVHHFEKFPLQQHAAIRASVMKFSVERFRQEFETQMKTFKEQFHAQ